MSDKELLERIIINPQVMVGRPVVRGTRLTVEFILNLLAHGLTAQDIMKEYSGIAIDDIQACLLFATKSIGSNTFLPLAASNE